MCLKRHATASFSSGLFYFNVLNLGYLPGSVPTDPPGALKIMPLRGFPQGQPPSSSSLSAASVSAPSAPALISAQGAAQIIPGPVPQALYPMIAVEQSCPTPTAADAAGAAATAEMAASLGTAAELATGTPPTEDLEAASLTEGRTTAVPMEGATNASEAAAAAAAEPTASTTTEAAAAATTTADGVAPSSSTVTSALAALAALAAGPEASAAAAAANTAAAPSSAQSLAQSATSASASELAAASTAAASISTATAAAVAALAGEPLAAGGKGEVTAAIGYRSLDEFAADLAQIWWNAEQVFLNSKNARGSFSRYLRHLLAPIFLSCLHDQGSVSKSRDVNCVCVLHFKHVHDVFNEILRNCIDFMTFLLATLPCD